MQEGRNNIPSEEMVKSIVELLKPYKMMINNIASGALVESIKELSLYHQLAYNGMLECVKETKKLYANMNLFYTESKSFANMVQESVQEMRKSYVLLNQLCEPEMLKRFADSMSTVSKSISSEQIKVLRELDYSTMYTDIVSNSGSLADVVNAAYVKVQDEEIETGDENDCFTEEEIQEALQEQVKEPLKFQERVALWTEKKKKQYYIICTLFAFVYSIFIQPFLQDNIGRPVMTYVVSNVKELPQKGALVIDRIQENIEAVITENTNYYYKVIYVDENGETKEGYVAKRNLKFIEEEAEEILPEND